MQCHPRHYRLSVHGRVLCSTCGKVPHFCSPIVEFLHPFIVQLSCCRPTVMTVQGNCKHTYKLFTIQLYITLLPPPSRLLQYNATQFRVKCQTNVSLESTVEKRIASKTKQLQPRPTVVLFLLCVKVRETRGDTERDSANAALNFRSFVVLPPAAVPASSKFI